MLRKQEGAHRTFPWFVARPLGISAKGVFGRHDAALTMTEQMPAVKGAYVTVYVA